MTHMDLYEALKAGTSAEELLKAFHKDLDAAAERIAAEEYADDRKEYIADMRRILAETIVEYVSALFGDDLDEDELSIELVEGTLVGFEKEMEKISRLNKSLTNTIEKASERDEKKPVGIQIKTRFSDDDIISNFIKSLK